MICITTISKGRDGLVGEWSQRRYEKASELSQAFDPETDHGQLGHRGERADEVVILRAQPPVSDLP